MSKRSEYRQTQNEGGEGYNPYKRRESAEPEWSRLSGKIERMEARLCSLSSSDPRYDEIKAGLALLKAAR